MELWEFSGITLAAAYILLNLARRPRVDFLLRLGVVAAAAWVAEESCIRLYRFYQYSPDWRLVIGNVPLLVVIVWPVVIHSAQTLAAQLFDDRRRLVPLVGSLIVGSDAAFIEPLAVQAGLWGWQVPGVFGAPPIGICGWFFFAFGCIYLLERRSTRNDRGVLALIGLVPVAVHVLLLSTWWSALRWLNLPLPAAPVVALVWVASVVVTTGIVRSRAGTRLHRQTLLLRLPGALFFFALLGSRAAGARLLPLYALAFVPPYIVMMIQHYCAAGPPGTAPIGQREGPELQARPSSKIG